MKLPEFRTAETSASILKAKPAHLEEVRENIDSVLEKISSGHAFLEVVAYPWGVEFDVCDVGESK